jgi:hypothetical protein
MSTLSSGFRSSLKEIGIGGALGGIGAIFIWLAAATASTSPENLTTLTGSAPSAVNRMADFGDAVVSRDVKRVADWIANSSDNGALDFIILDKKNAAVHVFSANAHLHGSSPVLIGSARGDDSVPGIGLRPINKIRAEERTTPAGRFVAQRGRNTLGEDIVWIDYDAAVSMHRVRANNPDERRLERLATPTADDNRISYGCINVPARFYEAYIQPAFAGKRAVVYVLPEVKSMKEVFGFHVSDDRSAEPTTPPLP